MSEAVARRPSETKRLAMISEGEMSLKVIAFVTVKAGQEEAFEAAARSVLRHHEWSRASSITTPVDVAG